MQQQVLQPQLQVGKPLLVAVQQCVLEGVDATVAITECLLRQPGDDALEFAAFLGAVGSTSAISVPALMPSMAARLSFSA